MMLANLQMFTLDSVAHDVNYVATGYWCSVIDSNLVCQLSSYSCTTILVVIVI
jgi:hypothetical protein